MDWNDQNKPVADYAEPPNCWLAIPVMARLLDIGADEVEMLFYENTRDADDLLWVTPDVFRYGCLPVWFPTTNKHGLEITPLAQVNRFLNILNSLIELSADHRETKAETLIWGLTRMGKYWIEIQDSLDA